LTFYPDAYDLPPVCAYSDRDRPCDCPDSHCDTCGEDLCEEHWFSEEHDCGESPTARARSDGAAAIKDTGTMEKP
jgi:hypothetical protein